MKTKADIQKVLAGLVRDRGKPKSGDMVLADTVAEAMLRWVLDMPMKKDEFMALAENRDPLEGR